MSSETERIKCLIIGSGPAGYTAAIYAARADLKPVILTGLQPGGQLTITTEVENYPGYAKGTMGPEMMEDFKAQAERFGTDIRFAYVTEVDFSSGPPYKITVDETKFILADTVIVATGASAKWLGLDSEQRLNGFGVSACATCDGYFFRGQEVAVVGAGDTAAEEATYLSKLCKKVYMIIRRDEMRASKAMIHRVENTANIERIYNSETVEILGGKTVDGARLKNVITGEETKIDVTGFFIAIGHKPNTEIFAGKLDMDANGYLKVVPGSTRTNIEGVFAAGDVADHIYRQAITAAGTGCMAAIDAERYLAAKGIH
ncbi:MAG: thioredoxin-disulfide reductase [Bacteroidota bacterium]